GGEPNEICKCSADVKSGACEGSPVGLLSQAIHFIVNMPENRVRLSARIRENPNHVYERIVGHLGKPAAEKDFLVRLLSDAIHSGVIIARNSRVKILIQTSIDVEPAQVGSDLAIQCREQTSS